MILKSISCIEEKLSQSRSENDLSRKNRECMLQRSYTHTHLQHTHTNHEIISK